MTTQPIVILEGIDGSGKTTLAAKLAKALQAFHVHHGTYRGTKPTQLVDVYRASLRPALLGYAPVVLDRAWYSEPIYGAVFRNGANRLSQMDVELLEALMRTAPSLVVVMHLTLDEAWASVSGRLADELPQHRQQLQTLHSLYASAAWPDGTLHIDRRDSTPDELAAMVLRAVNAVVAVSGRPA